MKTLRMSYPRSILVAVLVALGLAACGSSSHGRTASAPPSRTPTSGTPTSSSGTPTSASGTPTNAGGSATATSRSATPPGNLAQFKADIIDAQRRGRALGPELTSTLQHASKMTDAEIVRHFTALSEKVGAYARSVSNFPAPAKFRTDYGLVVDGFHSVASDLAAIANLAAQHAGTARGKAAIEKLYVDLQGLSRIETNLDKAVGLPG